MFVKEKGEKVMKKRYLVTTVAMLAAVSMLAACGNNKGNGNDAVLTPTVTTAPTETPDNTTPEPTETPVPVIEEDHAQMVDSIYQAVVEHFGEAYYPDMQIQNEAYYMENTLKLDASWYDKAIVEIPMMSSGADMFAIIHPTEGNLENVKKAMDDYKSYLVNDSFQYPMNMPKVQAAVVETLDDEYVIFSILTGLANMETGDDVKAYEDSSRIAVEIAAQVISGELTVIPWQEIDLVYKQILKTYGTTYYPDVKIHEDETYLSTYLSDTLKIDAAWVEDIIIEVPMISANVDELILVKPTEGNAENVLNALKAYKTYLVEGTRQYPMNEGRVRTAAVEQVGEYVCFSILGGAVDNPEDMGITTEEELDEYYGLMNENAINAIKEYFGIWE